MKQRAFAPAAGILLAGALLVATTAAASAQQLGIGDPAPKLEVKEFVKGTPVASFEKGKTYVVEFWATWCGPCKVSIPHLTELQKKYKDVTFVGVSVWENDQKGVKPFVSQMGEKMGYCVAMDTVPEGGTGNDGRMAKTWMQAAGQNGIPAAFIINGDGKIAWIGHPMAMDAPLEKVTSGKWDIATAAAEMKKEKAREQKLMQLGPKVQAAQQSGDMSKVLAVIDQAIAEDASLEEPLAQFKFMTLAKVDKAKAAAYGSRLVETIYKDNAEALNGIAWSLIDPAGPKATPAMAKIALKAALRADAVTNGKDSAIADTLAKAYFDNGNAAKAVETQQRAIKLAEGTPLEKDPDLKKRLEEYRKGLPK